MIPFLIFVFWKMVKMKMKIETMDDPKKVKDLTECYKMIDYYYSMIEVAEKKRDLLIKDMSLNDIRIACYQSSK